MRAPIVAFGIATFVFYIGTASALDIIPDHASPGSTAAKIYSSFDASGQFLEISRGTDTWTYDLRTVQLIEPGKFTVIVTVVGNPDVLKLRVKALDTLRTYCQRPDGQYPASASLFTLGKPDMPVNAIEVKSGHDEWMEKATGRSHPKKEVTWRLPYTRLAWPDGKGALNQELSFVMCWGGNPPNGDQWYFETRSVVMNGTRTKYLYDCKRGVMGSLHDASDDVSKAIMSDIRGGFRRDYLALCQTLTGKPAYLPN